MLIGFLDEGEGNTFIGCSADSPRLASNALPPSRQNGGYGFYGDTYSMNRRLIGCTVQLTHYGDEATLPPPRTIIPVHCGQVHNSVIGLEVRDYGKAGFGRYVTASSPEMMRQTTVIGGNIPEDMVPSPLLPRQDAAPFAPGLRIGGSARGILQRRQSGFAKRIAGMTFFELHLELASKGMAEGAVSIAGLPDAALNRDSAHRTAFSAAVEGWANREVVVAVLAGGSATLELCQAIHRHRGDAGGSDGRRPHHDCRAVHDIHAGRPMRPPAGDCPA